MPIRGSFCVALAATLVGSALAAAAPAGAVERHRLARTSVTVTQLSGSRDVTVGETVYLEVGAQPVTTRPLQVQTRRGGGSWTVARRLTSSSYFRHVEPSIAFQTPGSWQIRVVAPATRTLAAAVSRTATFTVEPVFPVSTVAGSGAVVRESKTVSERLSVGALHVDSRIVLDDGTVAFPDNGTYLTVPVTIASMQGKPAYGTDDFELQSPDGQISYATSLESGHGIQPLAYGTLTDSGSVSGTVVFDVPASSGYTLLWAPGTVSAVRIPVSTVPLAGGGAATFVLR